MPACLTEEEWRQVLELSEAVAGLSFAGRLRFLESASVSPDIITQVLELTTGDGSLLELTYGVEAAPELHLTPGLQIGRFTTVECLGVGGMGEVWSAHDSTLDRIVALKFFFPGTLSGLTDRHITREARAASALNHANIVTIHEIVHSENMAAMVMEFVDGTPLRHSTVRLGRLGPGIFIRWEADRLQTSEGILARYLVRYGGNGRIVARNHRRLQKYLGTYLVARSGDALIVSTQGSSSIHGIWRCLLQPGSMPQKISEGGVDAITPTAARFTDRLAWVDQAEDTNVYRLPVKGKIPAQKLIASTRRTLRATEPSPLFVPVEDIIEVNETVAVVKRQAKHRKNGSAENALHAKWLRVREVI